LVEVNDEVEAVQVIVNVVPAAGIATVPLVIAVTVFARIWVSPISKLAPEPVSMLGL